MTKSLNVLKSSVGIIVGTSLLALATILVFAVPAHKTSAATMVISPDILVGRDLTVGSTGQDVVILQGLLSELGYLHVPFGVPLGYFGSLTKAALAKYQSDMNVAPASGYYGVLTKIAMRTQFASHNWLALLGW